VQDIKARNAGARPNDLQRIVDNALGEVRAHRRSKRRARKG
jgi:hypothetical protein